MWSGLGPVKLAHTMTVEQFLEVSLEPAASFSRAIRRKFVFKCHRTEVLLKEVHLALSMSNGEEGSLWEIRLKAAQEAVRMRKHQRKRRPPK
jgi:hypothetical protein